MFMKQKLCMAMIFQIEAKSEKAKENMRNRIREKLETILGKSNLFLEYDEETNSFAYMEEDVKESFDEKAIFLLKTLQNFGYSYVVTGNLESEEFDICTSKTKISGIYFIEGLLH
ncbi:hypothetical protein A2U10_01390 [Fusobacterium necrophorum subsp. funduliforme]|uniref:Uncharacterized protein n=2 Tax=Fusobacterium necrophorum TaxID=859 RepID=A0AAN3VV01_9FUSO|nr:hypothetical protein BWX37_04685 [Fusobacterium necrophorum subsp. funduliforme]EJU16266.1 hypothetical protein HMPREF1127_0993 [Fusobacterium necrophorum subsp. funduliforme Fnf 1007]KYK99958.1 hypothetical protein A2J05_07250 [Fusobacterium necrophorum subsp. funduliforme]KYL00248.1 hypothetical protein A2J06_05810 [Fusobacterium necrophorum subsp. funduliforme]KYM37434.1 hypothetical protein A2U03_05930 [Fusobacterium necrophorum subsp. funduliforme]